MKGLVFIGLCLFSICSQAATFNDKTVTVVHGGDTRDCFFFQLDGVSEAGSGNPNNPWFAFKFGQDSSSTSFSILLAAKASGATVNVNMTGGLACGYAEAKNVSMY